MHVVRSGGAGLEVSGQLRAKIRQTCVVTLDDFDSELDAPVHIRFAPPPRPAKGAAAGPSDRAARKGERRRAKEEEEPAPSHIIDLEEDAPDPLIGGAVDLGAVVGEFLALNLDPYPRKPGAAFEEPASAEVELGPFAALRRGANGPPEDEER